MLQPTIYIPSRLPKPLTMPGSSQREQCKAQDDARAVLMVKIGRA